MKMEIMLLIIQFILLQIKHSKIATLLFLVIALILAHLQQSVESLEVNKLKLYLNLIDYLTEICNLQNNVSSFIILFQCLYTYNFKKLYTNCRFNNIMKKNSLNFNIEKIIYIVNNNFRMGGCVGKPIQGWTCPRCEKVLLR